MRTTVTTWTGAVTSPQLGTRRLTLNRFRRVPVARGLAPDAAHPHFHATFEGGWLRGFLATASPCARTPDRCWTGQRGDQHLASLHTYRGLKLAEGGSTPADDLAVAKPFRFDADPHGGGC